jgi:hypothetical protein
MKGLKFLILNEIFLAGILIERNDLVVLKRIFLARKCFERIEMVNINHKVYRQFIGCNHPFINTYTF